LLAIVARLINSCWFLFKWGLILIVVAAALAVPYFYRRMDDEIRKRIETRLTQHYPGLKVTIRSAVLVKGEGIEVRGLSIIEPGAAGPGAELFNVDECFLHCRTDLRELIGGEPEVTQVTIRRPALRMTRRTDGTWSTAKLLPLPKFGKRNHPTTIENGTVEIFDPLKSPSGTLMLRDINLTLTPVIDPRSPTVDTDRRKLQGTLSGDYFRQVIVDGVVDPHRPGYGVSGSVAGLEISSELRDALPGPIASHLALLGSMRGQADLEFRVAYDPSSPVPFQYSVAGRLARGRIDDPRLPHPLTDVRASVRLDNDGFVIDEFTGRSNQATLHLSAHGKPPGPGQPLALEAKIRQFELDRQLLEALPEKLQDQWYKYRPEGKVDADVNLSYDGQRWRPRLTIGSENISFAHHKFPYRLEHGKGTLTLEDDVLRVTLAAYTGNQLVSVKAEVQHPMSGPVGWVEANGEDIPVDEKLLGALPERPRKVARSLDVRGTVNAQFRMWRDVPEGPMHKFLAIDANRCWIRYEKFPYSLANIRGALVMNDDTWEFHNLEATNGTTRVTCKGSLTPTPQGNELSLQFRANDVPLDEELRDALRPAMQQVWNYLKPRGMIDLVADVRYLDGQNLLNVTVRAEPLSETTSIEPTQFPYRMEKLQGVFTYCDGRVTLEHFKADHGPVTMAATGICDFLPDGGWHLRLENLTVDRLRVDTDLMQAVPARLKKGLGELKPSGAFSLRGSFDLARGGGVADPVCSQWDLAVGLQRAGFDCCLNLNNIYGNVTLAGGFDGRSFHSSGELGLESLTYKDCQFTQVMGPLWIDDQQLLLGGWADRKQSEVAALPGAPPRRPRPLTADIFGGKAYGDAWVALGAEPRYGAHAELVDAQLSRCARETMTGQQDLRGRVVAAVDVHGAGRTRNNMGGRGFIQLRDANVYELPQMISLLKLLSLRAPDGNAFSKSDINFRIEGEHVYFDRLDFTGDAISLLGKGEMDTQLDVHLLFTAIVGRGELNIPVVHDIFKGVSQQFMLIHVDGPLQRPEMTKKAFPGLDQALQQLQTDLQGGGSPPGPLPQAPQQGDRNQGGWNR
jgi:hypothetical protein